LETRWSPVITGSSFLEYLGNNSGCPGGRRNLHDPTDEPMGQQHAGDVALHARAGHVHRAVAAFEALRKRVSMSAMGRYACGPLPARLDHARDFARSASSRSRCGRPESSEKARAAGRSVAPIVPTHPNLACASLNHKTLFGHTLLPERHAQLAQQSQGLRGAFRGRDDGEIHAADLVDLVVVDFRKNDLLADAHRVVSAPVEPLGGQPRKSRMRGTAAWDEPFQELPHAVAPQRDRDADRIPRAA